MASKDMHGDKWFAIWLIAVTLTVGSCTAFDTYTDNQYKIAALECEKVE